MACAGAHRSALVAARLALTDVPRRRGASATGSRPRRRDAHRGWRTPTRANALADATPPASSTPSGDAEETLGADVAAEGVVTRRHTLGRNLTFVDVTVSGPSAVAATATATATADASHFVFLKCWGVVDKRARLGARVSFTGRVLTNDKPRESEGTVAGRSYYASVPAGGLEVVRAASAEDVANATTTTTPRDRGGLINISTPSARRGASVPVAVAARVCKSLIVRGACGDPNCARRHDVTDAELAAAMRARDGAARRSRDARRRELDPDDPHAFETKAESDRIFADWIVRTFGLASAEDGDDDRVVAAASGRGRERASRESVSPQGTAFTTRARSYGDQSQESESRDVAPARSRRASNGGNETRRRVADVAGGGGVLSFELHVRHGLDVVLVDPARVGMSPKQRATLRCLRKRGAARGVGDAAHDAWRRSENWATVADAETDARRSRHLARVLTHTEMGEDAARRAEEIAIAAGREEVVASTLSGGGGASFRHVAREFLGPDDVSAAGLAECDVFVGMHPDQATEAIVDAALAMNKPFAVVPCCVFPRLFPNRRTAAGTEVTGYVDFLEYLVAKDPRIELGYLPFKGRNRVVYRV